MSTPPLSKRPFGHPLPISALALFCHPGGAGAPKSYTAPFSDDQGNVYACNGWLAIRAERYAGNPPPQNPAALERILKVFPADGFENRTRPGFVPMHEREYEKRWRLLDDDAGRLWRFGPKVAFSIDARGKWHLEADTPVRVGVATLAPLPLLQLLARLPRARVWIDNSAGQTIRCRWNGGIAVIANAYGSEAPKAKFGVCGPMRDEHTRNPIF